MDIASFSQRAVLGALCGEKITKKNLTAEIAENAQPSWPFCNPVRNRDCADAARRDSVAPPCLHDDWMKSLQTVAGGVDLSAFQAFFQAFFWIFDCTNAINVVVSVRELKSDEQQGRMSLPNFGRAAGIFHRPAGGGMRISNLQSRLSSQGRKMATRASWHLSIDALPVN